MSEANDFLAATPAVRTPGLAALARSRVSTSQARLSRLMRRGCEAACGDAVLELQFAPDAAPQWQDTIVLAGPFGEIECEDGPRLLRALTGIEPAGAAGTEAQAAWLNAAIIGRLSTTPFARADRLLCQALAPATDTTVVRLVLRSPQHAITTHTRASATAWLAFLQDGGWMPRRAEQSLFAGVSVEAPVRIARHTLPAHAMRTLAAGDIVVPDSPAFDFKGTGKIRLGGTSARVRYQASASLYIISTEANLDSYEMDDEHDDYDDESDYMDEEDDAYDGDHDEEYDHTHDEEHGDANEAAEDDTDDDEHGGDEHAATGNATPAQTEAQTEAQLDRVPVTLDFELGKIRLPLGELRALAAGSVVEIEGGSPSLITVRCGGRKLGQGEIVEVDGRLGIRLTDWRA